MLTDHKINDYNIKQRIKCLLYYNKWTLYKKPIQCIYAITYFYCIS